MRATYIHTHPLCKTGKAHPQVLHPQNLNPISNHQTPPRLPQSL